MAGVQLASSNNMTDFRMPMQSVPARKPVGGFSHAYPYHQSYDGLHPAQQQPPQQQLSPHPTMAPMNPNNRRMSTVPPSYMSSPQYPTSPASQQSMGAPGQGPVYYPPSRRLSTATTSSNSTGNNPVSDIRRSTSSRSANAQLGYVALMRRQKATVWCDRAQPEDPRLRAQKVAEKKRAYLEVHGAGAGRTGTLGSGKHKHGTKGTTDFSPSTLVGATVPVRLSANEVGDDGEEDAHSDNGLVHRRTGSGRSSLGSSHRYPSGYQRQSGPGGSLPSNNLGTPGDEKSDLPGVSEHPQQPEISQEDTNDNKPMSSSSSNKVIDDDAASFDSGGGEPEEYFGTVGDMSAPSAALSATERAKRAEELKRRGSVDDRTTSMSGVRLFVANPDE